MFWKKGALASELPRHAKNYPDMQSSIYAYVPDAKEAKQSRAQQAAQGDGIQNVFAPQAAAKEASTMPDQVVPEQLEQHFDRRRFAW